MSLTQMERPVELTVIDRGVLPTTEVIARVHRIQEVMKALMKDGVHFGKIPGTPKPTLYKPGAELLLMTFRIAASPSNIEDLSTSDEIRYRVTVRGTNQVTGEVVGEMSGECSSNEEKYRWRKPVCKEEFDETPTDRRREKWSKSSDGAYRQQQVRTSPADVANTILKMAIKRAMIAMTLVTLGASDIFAQDLEDLSQELRESLSHDEADQRREVKPPKRKSESKADAESQVLTPCVILKVHKGKEKKFHTISVKDESRFFTTFDDAVAAEALSLVGAYAALTFTVKSAGEKTYYNVSAVTKADAPTKAPQAADAPITQADIFGSRDVGQEG